MTTEKATDAEWSHSGSDRKTPGINNPELSLGPSLSRKFSKDKFVKGGRWVLYCLADNFTNVKLKTTVNVPQSSKGLWPPDWGTELRSASEALTDAVTIFSKAIEQMISDDGKTGWGGEAALAARDNGRDAVIVITKLAQAIDLLGNLHDHFYDTLVDTMNDLWALVNRQIEEGQGIFSNYPDTWPAEELPGTLWSFHHNGEKRCNLEDMECKYSDFAVDVMNDVYIGKIREINNNHPDVGKIVADAPANPNTNTYPGPSTNGNPASSPGFDTPSMPDTPGIPDMSTLAGDPTTDSPVSPADALDGVSDAAQQAGQAANQAGQGAQDALGDATQAGQQALQDALNAAQNASNLGNVDGLPDEGALNLGAGTGGLAGRMGGTGAGTGGTGTGGRTPSLMRQPSTQASTPVSKTSASTAQTARSGAGVSGTGAAGAPGAAGNRGVAQAGVHKSPKYIRSTTQGRNVAGLDEVTASVDVVGAEPEEAATPKAPTRV